MGEVSHHSGAGRPLDVATMSSPCTHCFMPPGPRKGGASLGAPVVVKVQVPLLLARLLQLDAGGGLLARIPHLFCLQRSATKPGVPRSE